MHTSIRRATSVLLALIALSSCATVGPSRDKENAGRIIGLINSGMAGSLSSMSELPFILDQEVVVIQADVDAFWQALVESDVTEEGAVFLDSAPVTDTSFKEFADTMEVKAFFSRYVAKGTRLLTLAVPQGKRMLLLVHDEPFRQTTIRGIKGPY